MSEAAKTLSKQLLLRTTTSCLSPLLVRHYGFAHPRSKIDPEWLKMLVTATLNLVYELIVAPKRLPVPVLATCPHCGGVLSRVAVVPAPVGRPAFTNSS